MAHHKQVEVYNPKDDNMTEIDEGIVELIQLLWDLGIKTDNSCQENRPGVMWVSILGSDVERFLTIIASKREEDLETEDPPSSIYGRIRDPAFEGSWDYQVCLKDSAEKYDEESYTYYEGKSKVIMYVSIRFPVSDYGEILDRLREFATGEEENVPAVNRKRKSGRNDPCWCGSGKKYKKCHLDEDSADLN